jgi:hypothetical protein
MLGEIRPRTRPGPVAVPAWLPVTSHVDLIPAAERCAVAACSAADIMLRIQIDDTLLGAAFVVFTQRPSTPQFLWLGAGQVYGWRYSRPVGVQAVSGE